MTMSMLALIAMTSDSKCPSTIFGIAEVDERGRADAPAHRLGRAVGDHVIALLTLRAFHRHVSFAERRTRAFHHELEVVDHRLHLARGLRLVGRITRGSSTLIGPSGRRFAAWSRIRTDCRSSSIRTR